ncbi:MAG: hypothetical protein M3R50_03345 [Bacteroidota bacterium]|nr:hypothetical protein [Bacteroidota bacterium]
MKRRLLLVLLNFASFSLLYSQGCIVVRNVSGFGQCNLANNAFTTGTSAVTRFSWVFNFNCNVNIVSK